MAETTKKAATTALPKEVFAVEVSNHELLKLAYDSFLANARLSSAHTKQRGEVSGGGKKPWKQKGTGRARFGSTRNPIWRGGGVVFGPRGNENYKLKLSTTSKRVALRQALTLANEAKKIVVTDVPQTAKTAEMATFFAEKNLNRNVLLVVDQKTPELIRSTANLQNVLLVRATYLSVYYILNADHIVMTPAAVKAVQGWLTTSEKEEK